MQISGTSSTTLAVDSSADCLVGITCLLCEEGGSGNEELANSFVRIKVVSFVACDGDEDDDHGIARLEAGGL